MKYLMFAVLVAASVALAEETAPAAAPAVPVATKIEAAAKDPSAKINLTPEERKAKREAAKAQRDERLAKTLGISVDEVRKMSPKERSEKLAAKRAAAKAAIDERHAKMLGITVEELQKLTPAERKEKLTAARKAAKAAKQPAAK